MLSLILLVLFSLTLIIVLTVVSFFISELTPSSREENSTYECGFEHHSFSRLPFSIRYFMLTLVFLIFDMEVIFLLFIPGSFFVTIGSWLYSCSLALFVLVLFLGLVYEWVDGSLDWVM